MKKVVLKWGTTIASKMSKARLVRQSMADNALIYPTPDPPLQNIADKVDELEEADAAAQQGGSDRILARDARLAELTALMQREVLYVQLMSRGIPELVAKAGLDVQDDPARKPLPGKVVRFEVSPGGNLGTIQLVAFRPDNKLLYVFQRYVTFAVKPVPAEPNAPAPSPVMDGYWETLAVQGRGRLLVSGLVSGSNHRFRVAAVNAAGIGDYSDVVTCVAR
jgi:hypothetical protein